jgi:hypothetical protein
MFLFWTGEEVLAMSQLDFRMAQLFTSWNDMVDSGHPLYVKYGCAPNFFFSSPPSSHLLMTCANTDHSL